MPEWEGLPVRPLPDAATAVNLLPEWPPADSEYISLLRQYDLRPSELDALRRRETLSFEPDASDAVAAYRLTIQGENLSKPHVTALERADSAAVALKLNDTVVAILLYTPSKRNRHTILLVHVHASHDGGATRLVSSELYRTR